MQTEEALKNKDIESESIDSRFIRVYSHMNLLHDCLNTYMIKPRNYNNEFIEQIETNTRMIRAMFFLFICYAVYNKLTMH